VSLQLACALFLGLLIEPEDVGNISPKRWDLLSARRHKPENLTLLVNLDSLRVPFWASEFPLFSSSHVY
jgi:hypothetical protein